MREPIPTWFFALAVVRRADQFLLVHERKHGQRWFLPAGRVEPGETIAAAACRETLEESGVAIELEGILRVEHTPGAPDARCRVFFLARAVGDATPRQVPDEESLGAAWVSLAELPNYPLRDPEVRAVLEHVAAGGRTCPLGLLVTGAQPWPSAC